VGRHGQHRVLDLLDNVLGVLCFDEVTLWILLFMGIAFLAALVWRWVGLSRWIDLSRKLF